MGRRQIRFTVVGIEHLHVFELVQGLLDAGAIDVGHAAAPGPLLDLYEQWRPDSPRVATEEALTKHDVDLVVLAGIPNERAANAVAALGAGRSVLSDKPGVTSLAQLEAVVDAERISGKRWWVLFSERWGNRAVLDATRRAAAGEIGDLVDVIGLGPHTLAADSRPDWFWSPETSGGILTDLATHQIDQFCSIVDPDGVADVEIVASSIGNAACRERPEMQDVGRVVLRGAGAIGTHRVDYLTAAGLGTWGDCRLMITGTDGTLEVRANIDPAGPPGGEHLIRVDRNGTSRLDTTSVELDWADRLVADITAGTDRFVSAAHVHRVCRLAIVAQRDATPWASPTQG